MKKRIPYQGKDTTNNKTNDSRFEQKSYRSTQNKTNGESSSFDKKESDNFRPMKPKYGRLGDEKNNSSQKPFKKFERRDDGGFSKPPFKKFERRDEGDFSKPPFKKFERRDDGGFSKPPFKKFERRDDGDFSKPPFKKFERRDEGDFSKPPFKKFERRDDGGFSKPPFKKFERRDEGGFSKPPFKKFERRDEGGFSKPPFKKFERRDDGGFSKPPFKKFERRDEGGFSKPPFKKFERRDDGGFSKPPFKKFERRDDGGFSKPPFKKIERPQNEIAQFNPTSSSAQDDFLLEESNSSTEIKKKNFRPYVPKIEQKKLEQKTIVYDKNSTRASRTDEENREFMAYKMSKIDEYEEVEIKEELNSRKQSYKPKLRNPEGELTDALLMPLNKFIAHCGICSRRDAVEIIKAGKIKVNQKAITEPGFKVNSQTDKIEFENKTLHVNKNFVYVLLNKPKDYITTLDDPQERRTVLELVRQATAERIYPIGRLDRNTTGVLLLTNDGALTQKLTHPKYEIKKIYHVTLNRDITKKDFDLIINGVELEDGLVDVDALSYVEEKEKNHLGIEIHSGRNRIVRRLFEHLGYEVVALDRVLFGGLTKKNVNRGKWRLLSEKEVVALKFLNASKGNR